MGSVVKNRTIVLAIGKRMVIESGREWIYAIFSLVFVFGTVWNSGDDFYGLVVESYFWGSVGILL